MSENPEKIKTKDISIGDVVGPTRAGDGDIVLAIESGPKSNYITQNRTARESEANSLGEAFHTLKSTPPTEIAVSRTKAMMAGRALVKLARENENAAKRLEQDFPAAAENARELAHWYTEVGVALLALDATKAHIVADEPQTNFTNDSEATT